MVIFTIKMRNYHLIKKSSTSHEMQYCEHFFFFPLICYWIWKSRIQGTYSSIQISLFTMWKEGKDVSLLQWLSMYPISKFRNQWCFDNRLMSGKPGVEKAGWLSNSGVISVISSIRKWLLLETRISFQWIVLLFVSCISNERSYGQIWGIFWGWLIQHSCKLV